MSESKWIWRRVVGSVVPHLLVAFLARSSLTALPPLRVDLPLVAQNLGGAP